MTAHLPETILVIDDEPMTPIDFSTIMIDLDGSVTGAEGKLTGVSSAVPTTSLSRNAFFDAPTQSDECLSFGLQTSPYEFVTTIVAPLAASPATTDPTSVDSTAWPQTPMVAIYRQWQTATDPATCGQVCDESDPSKYGCMRGTFMVGPNIGQAPYLTMAEPPGLNLSQQDGALYYIDTSTGSQQKVDCVRARTATMAPAPFVANTSYVVYNLFARNDSVVSYELFVGDGVNDLTAIKGRYVRVLPHLHPASTPDFNSLVHDACDPTTGSGWCATLPVPTVQNGILTLALDQRGIADDFKVSWRADYERCMPRDVCYFDGTQCQPCAQNPAQCIRQADFLPVDVQADESAGHHGPGATRRRLS